VRFLAKFPHEYLMVTMPTLVIFAFTQYSCMSQFAKYLHYTLLVKYCYKIMITFPYK